MDEYLIAFTVLLVFALLFLIIGCSSPFWMDHEDRSGPCFVILVVVLVPTLLIFSVWSYYNHLDLPYQDYKLETCVLTKYSKMPEHIGSCRKDARVTWSGCPSDEIISKEWIGVSVDESMSCFQDLQVGSKVPCIVPQTGCGKAVYGHSKELACNSESADGILRNCDQIRNWGIAFSSILGLALCFAIMFYSDNECRGSGFGFFVGGTYLLTGVAFFSTIIIAFIVAFSVSKTSCHSMYVWGLFSVWFQAFFFVPVMCQIIVLENVNEVAGVLCGVMMVATVYGLMAWSMVNAFEEVWWEEGDKCLGGWKKGFAKFLYSWDVMIFGISAIMGICLCFGSSIYYGFTEATDWWERYLKNNYEISLNKFTVDFEKFLNEQRDAIAFVLDGLHDMPDADYGFIVDEIMTWSYEVELLGIKQYSDRVYVNEKYSKLRVDFSSIPHLTFHMTYRANNKLLEKLLPMDKQYQWPGWFRMHKDENVIEHANTYPMYENENEVEDERTYLKKFEEYLKRHL